MKIGFLYIVLVFLGFPIVASSQLVTRFNSNSAFTFGEELTYRLKYSLYVNVNVGEATLKIAQEPIEMGNKQHYHFVATGTSYKFYDAFLKVRDRYESYVDVKSFLPSASIRVINEGRFHYDDYSVYDHQKRTARNKKGEVNRIGEFAQDIVSGIYLARTFDYNKAKYGDSFMLNIYIDDSNYLLGVKYLGKEVIKLTDGTYYRCVKLSPILIVDRVFKSNDDMILWISDDKNRIPIKVYSDIAVGSISVELYKYKGLKNNFQAKL
jgi:hypothetical protein